MKIIEKLVIKDQTNKTRLSDISFNNFKYFFSRKSYVKAIKNGEILVNDKRGSTGDWISNDDIIEVLEPKQSNIKNYRLDIEIVYEDDDLAVVNKPAGIEVSGNKFKTLENAIRTKLKPNNNPTGLKIPRPIHRLDYSTSGLIIFGKTSSAVVDLSKQFQDRVVEKKYHAIVIGKLPETGNIDLPIHGKEAYSSYSSLRYIPSIHCEWLTLAELTLGTGRTHQLRIHLSELDFPIVGDTLYGDIETLYKDKGLFLVSSYIKFTHPVTGKIIEINLELPNKFVKYMEREEGLYSRKNS